MASPSPSRNLLNKTGRHPFSFLWCRPGDCGAETDDTRRETGAQEKLQSEIGLWTTWQREELKRGLKCHAGLSERRSANYSLSTVAPPAHFRRTTTLAPTHMHTTAPNNMAEGSGIAVMT